MGRHGLFDQPVLPRLRTLIEQVRHGEILIPDFQRPFVWDDDRRLLLFDSIRKGMPIGSLLVWRTREHKLETYKRLGPFPLPGLDESTGAVRSYLLDGHQRLTTLFAALNWTDEWDLLQKAGGSWPVYYDLEAPPGDHGFMVGRRQRKPPTTWVPLSVLLEPVRLYAFQKVLLAEGNAEAAQRAEALANRLKDYVVPVIPLVTEDLEIVTDTFVRVNSQGKKMQELHIIHALGYSKFDLRGELGRVQSELQALGWGLVGDQLLLNALKVRFGMDVYASHARQLSEHLKALGAARALDELKESMTAAIVALEGCGVRGAACLPYAYQLVALAEVARRCDSLLPAASQEAVQTWFWATTYAGYFTGSTGSRIRDAIDHLEDVVHGRSSPLPSDLVREVPKLTEYNFNAVRTKARLLLMTALDLDDGMRVERQEHLGKLGAKAVAKIFPAQDSNRPENRLVVVPSELASLRKKIIRGIDVRRKTFPQPPGLPEPSADRDAEERELQLRKEWLEDGEYTFLKELGLEPGWDESL